MSNKTKAILYILCAALCFSLMSTFVKLSGDLPSFQKSFFRNLISFFVAFYVLKKSGDKIQWKKENLKYLLARSISGTIGVWCNFYAIDRLILSDSSMLVKLSPFFAIICSYFLIKEKVNKFQCASIIIAFIGSGFIVKPTGLTVSLPAIICIFSAACAGVAYTYIRILGNSGEKSSVIILFFSGFSCLANLPLLVFTFEAMTVEQLIYLLLAGAAATGGQYAITNAYIHAPAKEISVYDYMQVIFSAIIGFIIYNEMPDIYSFIGYFLICGVGIVSYLKSNDIFPFGKKINNYQQN